MSLLVTPWNPAEVYGILLRNREIAARKREAESRAISAGVESMLSNQRLAHQFAANLAFKQAHEENANQNYAARLALLSAQQASKNALDDPTPVRLPIESGPPGSLSGAGASSNNQPQLPANVGPNDFTSGSPEQVSPDEPVTTANTPSDASVAAMGASAQLPTLGDQGSPTPTSALLPEFTPQSGIAQAIKSLASGNVSGSSFGAVPDGKGGWMKDPGDNGIGASGIRTNDSNARGVALKPSQLLSAGGDGTKADFGRFNVRVSSPAGTTTEPIVDLLGTPGRVDMAPATYAAHGGPTNRGGGLIQNVQYDIVPKTEGTTPSGKLPMQLAQNSASPYTVFSPDAIARINEAGKGGVRAEDKARQDELAQMRRDASKRASARTGGGIELDAQAAKDGFINNNDGTYTKDGATFTLGGTYTNGRPKWVPVPETVDAISAARGLQKKNGVFEDAQGVQYSMGMSGNKVVQHMIPPTHRFITQPGTGDIYVIGGDNAPKLIVPGKAKIGDTAKTDYIYATIAQAKALGALTKKLAENPFIGKVDASAEQSAYDDATKLVEGFNERFPALIPPAATPTAQPTPAPVAQPAGGAKVLDKTGAQKFVTQIEPNYAKLPADQKAAALAKAKAAAEAAGYQWGQW
jgi:hypothetical protein